MEFEVAMKIVGISLPFPVAVSYMLGHRISGRCFLISFLALLAIGVAFESGAATAFGYLMAFFLLPLAIAPLLHLLQVMLLRRVEKQYGDSGVKPSIEWLGVYRAL